MHRAEGFKPIETVGQARLQLRPQFCDCLEGHRWRAPDVARAYRARLVSGPATGRVSRCVGSARALGECLTRIGTM